MRNQEPSEELKKKIFETARELFREQGFQAAGVRGIILRIGISIGTFYNYFQSKEELFLLIYLDENQRELNATYKRVPELLDEGIEPIEVIRLLIREFFHTALGNPILREFFNRDQFDRIVEKLTPEMDARYREQVFPPLIQYFKGWIEEGSIKPVSLDFFFALVNGLAFVVANRKSIGEEHFPQVLDFMIDGIVENLRA